MRKRVYIAHGWDGFPEEGWFPWLKKELEAKGFAVFVPQLPNPSEPRIHPWAAALADAVGQPDRETFFVGHSMGCQTIARYLESLPSDVQVGGAVFVAGFFSALTNLEKDAVVQDVVDEWLTTPLDLDKVKTHLPKSVAIFSDDDSFVPLDNQAAFREQLGSKIIIEHDMKHFSGATGTTELPVALRAVLELSQ